MMRIWTLRNRLRELFGLAPVPLPRGVLVPVPRIRVGLAGAVPGALVRLTPAVAVLAAAVLAGCSGIGWVLVAVAVVGVVWRPHGPVAALYTGLVGVWVIGAGDLLLVDRVTGTVPGVWRVGALMLAVHLLLVGAALAGHVAWRSFVEVAVVGRAVRTVAAGQAVAQSLLLLVAWLRAWQPGGPEWLRLFAVVAAVAVAALLVPREWVLRRRGSPSDD